MQTSSQPKPSATSEAGPVIARSPATGVAAALVTVIIWAGWIIATRVARESAISPITIGLLRYGPPAILLAPVWLRSGLLPRSCPWWVIAVMVGGSGAPFLLLAATAMRIAPAAEVGVLLPGTMPLWAAILGWVLGTSRFSTGQRLGYALITAGIILMMAIGLSSTSLAPADLAGWQGQALLLVAAACWAAYSHAFKRSGLTPLQGAAIVAAWSFIIHLLLGACFGFGLAQMSLHVLTTQLAVQGILSGLIAIFSYGTAVTTLGAARAASFSALAPVLAAFGGVVLLGEMPSPANLAAIALVTVGVALASGLKLWR